MFVDKWKSFPFWKEKLNIEEGISYQWPAKWLPLLNIRTKANSRKRPKVAVGLIAVGDISVGLISCGGMAVGAETVVISFTPTLRLAATGMGVALVTGILAGLAPAWQAARTEIVPALRQG